MLNRFMAALAAVCLLALIAGAPAHAQGCGPTNPNCIVPTAPTGTSNNQAASTAFVQKQIAASSGVFVGGATAGTSTAYTLATVVPSGFTLTANVTVIATFNATNGANATFSVNGTSATTISRRSTSGLTALVGGEIVANQKYMLVYDGSVWELMTRVPGAVEIKSIDYPAVPADFNGDVYVFTAAKTITLPAANTIPNNGTISVFAEGGAVTVALASGTDIINAGSAGASLTLSLGAFSIITTDGVGHWYVPTPTSGSVNAGTTCETAVYPTNGTTVSGVVGMANVECYGADPSGLTDSTAAFQAAVNALTRNGTLFIPQSFYTINGTVTSTKPITVLCGSAFNNPSGYGITATGTGNTIFKFISDDITIRDCYLGRSGAAVGTAIEVGTDYTTKTDFVFNGTTTVTCADCNFTSGDVNKNLYASSGGTVLTGVTVASVTNSTTIVLSANGVGLTGSGITASYGFVYQRFTADNLNTLNHAIGIEFADVGVYHVHGGAIGATNPLKIFNRVGQGFGASEVSGTVLSAANSSYGVQFIAGADVRFVNDKYLGGIYNFYMNWSQSQEANLVISNSSLENFQTAAIYLTTSVGFDRVVVANNSVAGTTGSLLATDNAGAAPINDLVVTGNTVREPSFAGTGISIGNVNGCNIDGNVIDFNGSGTGIALLSNSTKCRLGTNTVNTTTIATDAGTGNSLSATQMASGRLFGNPTASPAAPSEIPLAATLGISGGTTLTTANATGDVTWSSGSFATTLANIPSAVPMAGSVVAANIAAPSSPAAAHVTLYADSTDLRFHDKNAAGAIGTTVVADTGSSNNFLTAISAAGAISKAQPSISNISGFGAGVATWLGTPSSANLAAALTDETGTGAAVFQDSPLFTTKITAPLVVGGTAAGSSLTLQSTSGTGTTDSILFKVGTNGGTLAGTIGTSGAASFGPQTGLNTTFAVTQNTTQVDASGVSGNPLFHLVGANGTASTFLMDSYGSFPFWAIRRANGTAASKTAIVLNDLMMAFGGYGYDGSGYIETSAIVMTATENWVAGTAHGTRMDFYSTPTGTATVKDALRLQASGGLSVGNANIASDGGAGILVATGATLTTLANTATTSAVCYNTSTGVLTYDGTIGTCNASDERLKNIGPRIDDALSKLLSINGFYYTYKDHDRYGRGEQIGVGAQTVERVFPELVSTDSTGIKSVAYDKLAAPIIEAIRELKADNDNLRHEIENLKRKASK